MICSMCSWDPCVPPEFPWHERRQGFIMIREKVYCVTLLVIHMRAWQLNM